MGHANIAITLDHYGHLMPGSEDEAAGLVDARAAHARKGTREIVADAPSGLSLCPANAGAGTRLTRMPPSRPER